ncbi:MAG: MaoC family dehydratase [Cupriavidus necator]
MNTENLKDVPVRERGKKYEDFEVGQEIRHHWGRTLNETDNTLFCTLTLHFNPMYFNTEYATEIGYQRCPLNPLLVFNTVVGLSVEDLSEGGGPFLGIDNLSFHQPVYPGETIYAKSIVRFKRESSSNPGHGVVSWHTQGVKKDGTVLLEFDRTNLSYKRGKSQ